MSLEKRAILSLPEQELKAASAISQIDSEKELPPTLIMHGDKDDSVPFMQSVRLYEALKKAGKDVTFYKVKNAGHGGPEFWTEEILNIYDAFFRRCFQME
ncbi:MAG: S9 family peptidase [Clostridiales bacterium]|nr:S9 family peptidase [Clostridiales bacterium]